MELTMNMGAFELLNNCEMMKVDGGITDAAILPAVKAGAVIGGIGTAGVVGGACG